MYPQNTKINQSTLDYSRENEHDKNEYSLRSPYQRSNSQLSSMVHSNGIPSPLKWNVKPRRIIQKSPSIDERSEYLPIVGENRQKRSNYSSMSFNSQLKANNSFDINDIDGARPQPASFIRKKQQLLHNMNTKSHTLANSGRVTPLRIDRNYDSKRYIRVDDLDLKKKPGKFSIPQQHPAGFKDEINMLEYKDIPKQMKLNAQQGRLPFTRRYTNEKYGYSQTMPSSGDILHHVNQTHKDNDPDMKTRRFKADVRRSEPGAYSQYSASCGNSRRNASEIPSTNQSQILEEITRSQAPVVEQAPHHISRRSVDQSNRARVSNRKYLVNTRDFRKLPAAPQGYEYFEEVSQEEEEDEGVAEYPTSKRSIAV